ncbi:WxL domain-containing protein [Latilactobacillus sp. 5-91]|uniref:WxL domain-containing protein n=1 Tax=Latilactobacillus sp. 5-91 TaxID=3410924 RepID=UPI003C748DFD
MKFTKLTSTVLTASTLLAILAPATIASAATPKDDAAANGGTKLPMPDTTDAGISFGDTHDNGNSGYLRLQMVPKTLDFGNHAKYVAAHSNFDANGANLGVVGNDTHASFDQQDSNKTETLTTSDDELKAVQGTAWVTVVDKQVENPELAAATPKANTAGDWVLTVSADGKGLKAGGHTIADANLVFGNTKYARTADIYGLTNQDQDNDGYTAAGTTDATYAKSVSLNLSTPNEEKPVGSAAKDAGDGANVFGWNPSDIRLALNGSNDVATGEYHAGLTWTLNSTI